jgi:hypothetical protein
MIAHPLGGVAQRRASRAAVGLRPQIIADIPPLPPIPKLSITVPVEDSIATSSPLRYSTAADDPVSPVTDICVSPSWSDFGGKKRKKEKKAREKVRREIEKARKEQEKRLRKAREQETRLAKAAGQRPQSSHSSSRPTFYVGPISHDQSYNRQPWRTPASTMAPPVTSRTKSSALSDRSTKQLPPSPKPPKDVDFYSPQIQEKIIVDEQRLDTDDEYERDLITHAYHLTLTQSTKSLSTHQKPLIKRSLEPSPSSRTVFPISPVSPVSPMSGGSSDSGTERAQAGYKDPNPQPVEVDSCQSRIADASISIPHIPQEPYFTDEESISESGTSGIDGSENFASAEESYDDYHDRGETSDSDDYTRSDNQTARDQTAAASPALLRGASERLNEIGRVDSGESRSSSRTQNGRNNHPLSYADRQRLGSQKQHELESNQRTPSSCYSEQPLKPDVDTASTRSFLLDESPLDGPPQQQEYAIELGHAEDGNPESPTNSIGEEPESFLGRRLGRFSKQFTLGAVNLESTKAEDGFWEDLWPMFNKSESTSDLPANDQEEDTARPRISSVDSGRPRIDSVPGTDFPTPSKAEYSTEDGGLDTRPKRGLRKSKGSQMLSIDIPKRPQSMSLVEKPVEPQAYEPLTAKKVAGTEAMISNTSFKSAPSHQSSTQISPQISPQTHIETRAAEVFGHAKKVEHIDSSSPPTLAQESPRTSKPLESSTIIQALNSPNSLHSLPEATSTSTQEEVDVPKGLVRQLSITRTQSSPHLRKDNHGIPSDLSFLPELRHQALSKPEHSKKSSIDTSRGSSTTSGSSLLSTGSRISSLDFPSPTAPSIRSTSDDGIVSPFGASTTSLLRDSGMKASRPQRALLRPPIAGRRQTMAPPTLPPPQAGALIAQQQKPMAKMFVICCKCKFWHDLPSKIYEAMALPRRILEDEVEGATKGKVDTVVKCPWCEHGMSSQCCAGWTTIVYLHERHH